MRRLAAALVMLFLVCNATSAAAIQQALSSPEIEKGKFCILRVSPTELHPSEKTTVRITLKNMGNRSAYRVSAEVLAEKLKGAPVKVVGNARKSVGNYPYYAVGTDREVTVEFDFFVERNATPTVYEIPLCVYWTNDFESETAERSDILYFGLRVSGVAAQSEIDILNVSTDPEVLVPGGTGRITVEMQNVGKARIRTLNAVLRTERTPFTPLNGDLEVHFREIAPGERFIAEFHIAVEHHASEVADRIYYELPLVMEYSDDFASLSKNTSIGVEVRGLPNVLIQEITVEPSQLTAGTEGLFMLTLVNTGILNAENVKVRIVGGDDILTESLKFVGEIAPHDTHTVAFGIRVADDVHFGRHAFNILISYEDEFGKKFSNMNVYEISVFPAKPLIPSEYIYAGIFIITLVFIIYLILLKLESRQRAVMSRKKDQDGEGL
ncbi:MAG: hypothetical protein N2V77_06550 [Canidatus Methanoxibalbensis ujae]|nr:hypothetical protein [Candidatus Methanoxibalbensis ujae]